MSHSLTSRWPAQLLGYNLSTMAKTSGTSTGTTEAATEEDRSSEGAMVRPDLRAALQFAVTQICVEEDRCGGGGSSASASSSSAGARMSPGAVLALSELLYLYATTCLAPDLVAFGSHAGRKSINESDVLLVARKNPHIHRALQEFCQTQAATRDDDKILLGGRASTTAATARPTARNMTKARRASSGLTVLSPSAAPLHQSDDSSSESSDDGALFAQRRGPATANPGTNAALDFSSSDDTDNDDTTGQVIEFRGPRQRSSRAPPPKRFRLGGNDALGGGDDENDDRSRGGDDPEEYENLEDNDGSDDDLCLSRPSRSREAPSRIQQLLATMSPDSTMS